MAFNDNKSPGDLIKSQDWDDFVDFTEATSSNARLRYLQSGGTKWVDLTDSGDTTLHIHDSRYYTETESKSLFAASSSVSRALIDSISSNIDTRIDSIFNYSSNARRLYAGSSQVNRNLINSISSNLDSRIDSLFNWSSNALNKYGASSHTHDNRYYTETESLSIFAGSANINRSLINAISSNIDIRIDSLYNFSSNKSLYPASSLVNRNLINNISSNIDTRIDSLFNWSSNKSLYANSSNVRFRFPGSSSIISKYNASGKIAGLNISKLTTPISAKVLKWDVSNNFWSAQTDLTGGGGGTSSWVYLNASTGLTPWVDNTRAISGQGAALSLSVLGYTNISTNAVKGYLSGQKVKDLFDHTLYKASSISTSDVAWSGALGYYSVSSLTKKAYSSGQRVKDIFNHIDYITSSNVTRSLINTISSNLDTRVDSLFNYSSNAKKLYADSSNIRIRFPGSSAVKSRYYPSSLGHYFTNSGAKLHSAYISTSTGIFSIASHTHSTLGLWSGAYQFYVVSGLTKKSYASAQRVKDIFDHTLYAASGLGGEDVAWSGASGFYAISSIAFKSGIAEINMLEDVDTKSTEPTRDQVLKWNGTNWVPAAYNATFVFTIASFSDGESTTQLIGTGTWKAQSAMSYTATYNNGPPTTTWVTIGYNTTSYSKSGTIGEMTGPAYTAGSNSTKAISYPAAKDYYLSFRLSAQAGSDTDTETETSIYFRNYIYYGVLTKNKSISEADIESLTGTISNDQTSSFSINAGAGQYLVFAFPATYTSIPSGSDYESDGGTGFLFNSISCAFSGHAYVSVVNSAGYTENYKVYASNLPNLGNSSLVTTTSVASINPLYYGVTSKTDTFTEADVEGLANSEITNDNTQTWDAVNSGVGEYLLFAFPKRLGTITFWVGGFEGGFEDPETVSITNSNGWTEDYYVWRSENSNLGSTTVVTT